MDSDKKIVILSYFKIKEVYFYKWFDFLSNLKVKITFFDNKKVRFRMKIEKLQQKITKTILLMKLFLIFYLLDTLKYKKSTIRSFSLRF